MNKQRMIVSDDQLLIDMELLFNAIREANGDWEQVEQDMWNYLESVQAMTQYGSEETDSTTEVAAAEKPTAKIEAPAKKN